MPAFGTRWVPRRRWAAEGVGELLDQPQVLAVSRCPPLGRRSERCLEVVAGHAVTASWSSPVISSSSSNSRSTTSCPAGFHPM